MPEKLTNAPRSRQRRISSGPPVKQWKIVRVGTRSTARMSNVSVHASRLWITSGNPWVSRELDLGGERGPLRFARSVVVVVVEPGLADGDDAGCVEQVGDRVDAGRRLVRVQPDRGEDARVGGRGGDRRLRRGPVTPDRDHPRDAGLLGGRDGAGGPVGDPFVVDVAMGVDPGHVVAVMSRCVGRAVGPW